MKHQMVSGNMPINLSSNAGKRRSGNTLPPEKMKMGKETGGQAQPSVATVFLRREIVELGARRDAGGTVVAHAIVKTPINRKHSEE